MLVWWVLIVTRHPRAVVLVMSTIYDSSEQSFWSKITNRNHIVAVVVVADVVVDGGGDMDDCVVIVPNDPYQHSTYESYESYYRY